MDFGKAIQAHIQWKQRLQNCINDKNIGDLNSNNVCKDNLCDLGKWLHSDQPETIIKDPTFLEIIDRHKRFHEIAGSIVKRIEKLETLDADKELGIDSEYGKVSSKLIALLMRMRVKHPQ